MEMHNHGYNNISCRKSTRELFGGGLQGGSSFYTLGAKKLEYFNTFSAPKAPNNVFSAAPSAQRKFFEPFLYILGEIC